MDTIDYLLQKDRIIELVNELFVSVDNKDWQTAAKYFSRKVNFDMESVGGGPPTELTPDEITSGWDEGLKDVESLQHQSGNFKVKVKSKSAEVFCYGIAIHFRDVAEGGKTRTFVGSYDFKLERLAEDWKISSIKYNLKFLDGNLNLT